MALLLQKPFTERAWARLGADCDDGARRPRELSFSHGSDALDRMGRRTANHAVHAALSLVSLDAVLRLAALAQACRPGRVFRGDLLRRSRDSRRRAVGWRTLSA